MSGLPMFTSYFICHHYLDAHPKTSKVVDNPYKTLKSI